MANGHGGRRQGCGRKKADIKTQVLFGRADKELLPDLPVSGDMQGNEMPPPRKYLTADTHSATENRGAEIYASLWDWLKERDCHMLVSNELLQQYSLAVSRFEQVEEAINRFGFLAKHPTTGMPIESPYVKIAKDCQQRVLNIWELIELKIADRCSLYADAHKENPEPMEILLRQAREKRR